MKLVIGLCAVVLSSSCSLLSKLDSLGAEEIVVRAQAPIEISDKEWNCCKGLCSATPKSISKDAEGYLLCLCQRGTKFRVTKLAQASEYERL